MTDLIVALIVGVVFIVIGTLNFKGNISTIHKYHRKRVSEEDKKPFGRLCGTAMFIIAFGIIVGSVVAFIAQCFNSVSLNIVGEVIAVVGLIAGIVVAFYAMIKYNKGIF